MRLREMAVEARSMLLEFRGRLQTDNTCDSEAGFRTF